MTENGGLSHAPRGKPFSGFPFQTGLHPTFEALVSAVGWQENKRRSKDESEDKGMVTSPFAGARGSTQPPFIGAQIPYGDTITLEAAYSWVDWVMVDLEHGFASMDVMRSVLSLSASSGFRVFVRVPEKGRPALAPMLDLGVDGIILAHAHSASALQALSEEIKYPPIGHRGIWMGSRASDYGRRTRRDHVARSNRGVNIVALIEDREGVANLESIVNHEQVDGVLIGHNDMALSYGFSADDEERAVEELMHQIITSALKARKPVCIGKSTNHAARYEQFVAEWLAAGVEGFLLSPLAIAVQEAAKWRDAVDQVRGSSA